MSNSYKLTKKAVDDLTKIWNYTVEKWSEEQADKYYSLLLDSCKTIANNPELGKSYFEIETELLVLKQIGT
jgi:toxin ParE1/3/4